ncbi:MAG: RNA polymerase sigma factor [Ignavibacteriae bacterium]|nr:RNA polymerase sigma factor [Ignavibacteriota bacterium]
MYQILSNCAVRACHFECSRSQSYEQKELLDLIARSLELLSFEYREIFILREYDGLSYEEIAEVTGTTVTNAKTRAFRAKQKVKEILQPYLKDLCE